MGLFLYIPRHCTYSIKQLFSCLTESTLYCNRSVCSRNLLKSKRQLSAPTFLSSVSLSVSPVNPSDFFATPPCSPCPVLPLASVGGCGHNADSCHSGSISLAGGFHALG